MSDVRALLDQADGLPDESPVKLALYEEAVRICDAQNDDQRSWTLRMSLTHLIYYTGDWDKMFVHFGWLLAKADADPSRFQVNRLLWRYKWVVNNACSFPQVPVARAVALIDDMEKRMRNAGSTLRPVYQHRMYLAEEMGDFDQTRFWLDKWWRTQRDRWSDCYGCERSARASALDLLGDGDGAVEEWLDAMKANPCYYVPDVCRSQLLRHLVRRDELRSAAAQHRLGYAALERRTNASAAIARHLAYAVTRGRFDEAATMLDRHLASGLGEPTPGSRLYFMTRVVYVLDRLMAAGRVTLPLRLPDTVDVETSDAGVDAAALRAFVESEACVLTAAFDERHASDFTSLRHETYASRTWGTAPGAV